jgi:hypothetical protein
VGQEGHLVSIERTTGTCIVVHLADSETHFPDTQQAEEWIGKLDVGIRVHAIEEAQMPCWMAYCDNPACKHPESDENDNAMHIPGHDQAEVERLLSGLQRVPDGRLLCDVCRDRTGQPATTADNH